MPSALDRMAERWQMAAEQNRQLREALQAMLDAYAPNRYSFKRDQWISAVRMADDVLNDTSPR